MADASDPVDLDPDLCGDSDGDSCDDCTIGTDDFGPPPDNDANNDGTDTDGDGACDQGDPCPLDDPDDTDGDGVCDSDDPCPLDNPDDPDGDGVCTTADNCDLPNPQQLDCQPNGVGDVCDIAIGTSSDNNTNGVPDECEVQPPVGEDSLGLTCGGDNDCDPPGSLCVGGVCYVLKNRHLSVDPNPGNAGSLTARRISLSDLGGQSFVLGWVGGPIELTIAGPEGSAQLLSRIEEVPHYRDCSVNSLGQPWVDATVHIGDCETSPGAAYLIQSILEGMNVGDEASYSAALALGTATDFGDVVGGTTGMPPDGFRNFKDISAVVRGFQSTQTEPKVWLDLQGGTATPEIPNFSDINFADISHAVAGFQGGVYPFAAPCDCPGQSCL